MQNSLTSCVARLESLPFVELENLLYSCAKLDFPLAVNTRELLSSKAAHFIAVALMREDFHRVLYGLALSGFR